ncbi:diguanylate cyclase [Tumebacillus flagellatus]|uniref:GGDEF domain-containing protein n=1 Tax=Tumebacillus flagellatus TaxID=1157490 RepID=A0A074LP24_9BACL|nr:diguanylate cyclase [Tumebacillus flagellatus]KEO82245.1 hypothetical protein EL26_16470 [Tumebacillus flagellatus]
MNQSKDKVYIYAIILIACYYLSGVYHHLDSYTHISIIPLFLLGILVEIIQIPIGNAYGTLTFGVVLGTLILDGPYVAAPLAAVSVLFQAFLNNKILKKHQKGMLVAYFNAAQYSLCVFAAYGVFTWLGGRDVPVSELLSTVRLLILLPVALTYMVMNHLFVYTLFYLRDDTMLASNYRELFISDAMNYVICTPFAVFMLVFSNYLPFIFLTFLPLMLFGQVMKLYQKISRLNEVHQVSAQLQSEFDLDKIYNSIVEAAGKLTNCAAGVLWVLKGDRIFPVCSSDEAVAAQLPQEGMTLDQTGIVVNCVNNKRVELVDDVWKDRRVKSIKGKAHFESVLVVPLLSRDKVVGVITCYGTRPYVFSKEQTEWVTVLATQVGVIIENAHLYQELQEATLRDPGTGLYNYRYFYQELKNRMEMAKSKNNSLSIVIIDIDHFKKYNDTYGHVVGDEVLRQTGQVIQKTVGTRGVVARYGGEEFAVLLDESLEDAKQSVEHLRRAVAHNKFEYQGYVVQGVTVSVGLATYPDHDQDEKELLEKADQAMYWGAKQRGRNKVAVYTPDFDAHLFVDQLTGLYTYHYLHMKMMDEFTSLSKEGGVQFGLIFFNVIEFDNINRTFGFEVGNHVLREISVLIKQNVRHGEIASRYGGDEFLLLVPSVDRIEADRIRERIVKAITSHPFRVRDHVIVRVMMRSDVLIYPDEVAEEPQLISMIPETFLHLSTEWIEKKSNV